MVGEGQVFFGKADPVISDFLLQNSNAGTIRMDA